MSIFRKKKKVEYDSEKQMPALKTSICTGEKVAGFKDRESGHFTDVMLISSDADLERFKQLYGIEDIRTEY